METEFDDANFGTNMKPDKRESGHAEAGRKWDKSEKGRIWKAQTVKAKQVLHDILKRRTGLDIFANQRMTLKYAGLIRDGKTAEAKRIVEQVVANAKRQDKKNKTRRRVANRPSRSPKQVVPKENSAEFQREPKIQRETQPQPQLPQIQREPLPEPEIQFRREPQPEIQLPDLLD
jgi:hypothetical protein